MQVIDRIAIYTSNKTKNIELHKKQDITETTQETSKHRNPVQVIDRIANRSNWDD